MVSLFLPLLFLPALFLLLLHTHIKTKSRIRSPPGPRGLPLFGNLHQFDASNPHRYLWKLSKQYGSLVFLRLGSVPTLAVSSAKMAEKVLKTQDLEFCNRPALLGPKILSYNLLDLAFAPYNDYWREMRKICAVHLFSSNKVQYFRPIREDEVSRMIEKISKSVVDSKPINLSEIMMSLTYSITCRIAFGQRYEEGNERSRFRAMHSENQALFVNFFYSDFFPLIGTWIDKLTGMIRRLEKNYKEFDEFYQQLIDQHLDPERPKAEHEDIIDVLLQIRKDCGFKFDLSTTNIKALLMNVFVAGADTSAATVVWVMTYLMKNPKVLKKAQEEIRSSIGSNRSSVNEEDVQRLCYLKAIVKETMRLQPTAPLLLPRVTTRKCILDGHEIPAKTMVHVNAWAIGRDPEAWDNPEEFDPDRFIGSSIDLKGQHFELIPFGAGRRMCPGILMGIATVELSLANLLYKFNWEMPPGMNREELDFDCRPGLTMHKKNPLLLMAGN